MDLMDVPEPGATADPWGAGGAAGAVAGAGAGAGAGAESADPWQPYGIHTYTLTVERGYDYMHRGCCCGSMLVFLCSFLCACMCVISVFHLQLLELRLFVNRNAALLAQQHYCTERRGGRRRMLEEDIVEGQTCIGTATPG